MREGRLYETAKKIEYQECRWGTMPTGRELCFAAIYPDSGLSTVVEVKKGQWSKASQPHFQTQVNSFKNELGMIKE
jgi:hypothetical protein